MRHRRRMKNGQNEDCEISVGHKGAMRNVKERAENERDSPSEEREIGWKKKRKARENKVKKVNAMKGGRRLGVNGMTFTTNSCPGESQATGIT